MSREEKDDVVQKVILELSLSQVAVDATCDNPNPNPIIICIKIQGRSNFFFTVLQLFSQSYFLCTAHSYTFRPHKIIFFRFKFSTPFLFLPGPSDVYALCHDFLIDSGQACKKYSCVFITSLEGAGIRL